MIWKYKVIQACSVGRQQPKEVIYQWKANKHTPTQIVIFEVVSATLPTNTQALMQYMQQSRAMTEETQFSCNTVVRRGLKSHVTSYQASNTLLTILWLCVNSWGADPSSCLTVTAGQNLCSHAGQDLPIYLLVPEAFGNQCQIQLFVSLPSCQTRVSSIIWEFLLSAVGFFPLQPVTPPLQKKGQHRISSFP